MAKDGPAALKEARNFEPDVILVDIGLPIMDGYEVAQALRQDERFKQTILVAVTGYAHDSDRERAAQAGFNHHLAKPVSLDSVQRLLAIFRRR